MPLHKIHDKKKIKNYTLLAVLISMMTMFFFITIVKFQQNSAHEQIESEK